MGDLNLAFKTKPSLFPSVCCLHAGEYGFKPKSSCKFNFNFPGSNGII